VTRDTISKATANTHERTFDFQGVSAVMKNEGQIEAFRSIVTKPENRLQLPVKEQAAFAKKLAQKALAERDGLTPKYIREWTGHYIEQGWRTERKQSAAEKEEAERRNVEVYITNKLLAIQQHMRLAAYALEDAQTKAREHRIKKFTFPHGFLAQMDFWVSAAEKMRKGIIG
jgi:hypothetical protein